MLPSVYQAIDDHLDEMIDIRRYLHQYPELSFKEVKTARYITDYYKKLQIDVEDQLAGNAVIAKIRGNYPGPTVALRADFDALPIQDEKEVPYRSKVPGVMHACGHDAHTASLLVLAKIVQQFRSQLRGTILFLHQHAEEMPPGGAIDLVKSGALSEVEAIFGNHLWSTLPLGTWMTKADAFMAGADRFTITIRGKGGHGAYPEETKDAVLVSAEIVTKLQTIVSRKIGAIDTAVLTIGQIEAGHAFNIIADQAKLQGTVRYIDPDVQGTIKEEIHRILDGISIANGVTIEIDYEEGYPPLINSKAETALVFDAVQSIPDIKEVREAPIQLGAEDFAYYLQEINGCFFFTGAAKEGESYPHHHPMFDIDERAMAIAAKSLFAAYQAYQEKAAQKGKS